MGTSKGYKLPAGGNWTPLKKQASQFVASDHNFSVASQLLRSYVHANGGSLAMARGTSTGGDGGSGGSYGTAAARETGRKLGKFLSGIAAGSLDEALREAGLERLIGQSAADISIALLDTLAGPGSTLDQHAARQAANDVLDEFLGEAETYEEVEEALTRTITEQDLFSILAGFFGAYLYRRFCRDFYETWVAKVGPEEAANSLAAIKDCIYSAVKEKLTARPLEGVDWEKAEGGRLAEQVLRDVLDIFGVTE